jgi:hypothetical protein
MDANVVFTHDVFRPAIDALRRPVVEAWGEEWRSHMHVTISLAHGATARVNAVMTSLRIYRPSVLHMFELVRFWYEGTMTVSDINAHGYEECFEFSPAIPLRHVDDEDVRAARVRVPACMRA